MYRDILVVNNDRLTGVNGPEAMLGLLMRHILHQLEILKTRLAFRKLSYQIHGEINISESDALSCARDVLLACSRTQSGGDSYFCAESLLCNRDFAVLTPLSSEADPLEIVVDIIELQTYYTQQYFNPVQNHADSITDGEEKDQDQSRPTSYSLSSNMKILSTLDARDNTPSPSLGEGDAAMTGQVSKAMEEDIARSTRYGTAKKSPRSQYKASRNTTHAPKNVFSPKSLVSSSIGGGAMYDPSELLVSSDIAGAKALPSAMLTIKTKNSYFDSNTSSTSASASASESDSSSVERKSSSSHSANGDHGGVMVINSSYYMEEDNEDSDSGEDNVVMPRDVDVLSLSDTDEQYEVPHLIQGSKGDDVTVAISELTLDPSILANSTPTNKRKKSLIGKAVSYMNSTKHQSPATPHCNESGPQSVPKSSSLFKSFHPKTGGGQSDKLSLSSSPLEDGSLSHDGVNSSTDKSKHRAHKGLSFPRLPGGKKISKALHLKSSKSSINDNTGNNGHPQDNYTSEQDVDTSIAIGTVPMCIRIQVILITQVVIVRLFLHLILFISFYFS